MNCHEGVGNIFDLFIGQRVIIHTFSGSKDFVGNLISIDKSFSLLHLSHCTNSSHNQSNNDSVVIAGKDVKFIELVQNTNIPLTTLFNRHNKNIQYAKKRYSTYHTTNNKKN